MIPKIIHYCWFGKENKSDLILKCIDTWKINLPDYKFIEWNEENFDVNKSIFSKKAYEKKKWAFVSDYVRLEVLYRFGGIYLDTDVELIKNFDEVINDDAFIGFEDSSHLSSACIGSCAKNKFIKKCLDYYNNLKDFNPIVNTEIIYKLLFSEIRSDITKLIEFEDIKIYPFDYFCAYNYYNKKIYISENTICIHHFCGSWKSRKDRLIDIIKIKARKILGEKRYLKLKRNRIINKE